MIPAPPDPVLPGQPVIQMGPVGAGIVRTGGQTGVGALIVEGLQVFGLTHFTAQQATWTVTALTVLIASAVNLVENRHGRRLVGSGTFP